MLGSEKLFWTVLKEYFDTIDKKSNIILAHKAAEQWHNYTIEVHALKSTSRQIGADHIADMAAEMEKAGNDGNIALINEKTDGLIEEYRKLRDILKKYFADVSNAEERPAEFEEIVSMLNQMHEALDNFDTLQIDEVIDEMSKFQYLDDNAVFFERLKEAASVSDVDRCLGIVEEWGEALINSDNDSERTLRLLDNLLSAIDEFDILKIDAVVERMSRYTYLGKQQNYFESLRGSVENSDIAKCTEIVGEWKSVIENEL